MKIRFAPKSYVELEFHGIEILECEFTKPNGEIDEFDYIITVDNSVNPETSLVDVIIDIRLQDESDFQLAHFRVCCVFEIGNFKDLNWNNASEEVRFKIANNWNAIAISTARGMLFSEFKGTFLHNAILPLVNPGQYYGQ